MTHLNPIPATKWGRGVRRTKGTLRPVSALPDNSMCPYARPGHATALPARGDNKAFMLVPHKREPQLCSRGGLCSRKKGESFQLCMGLGTDQKEDAGISLSSIPNRTPLSGLGRRALHIRTLLATVLSPQMPSPVDSSLGTRHYNTTQSLAS